ncbi:NB-ARC domain-containing protein [Luedemannella flava]
MPEDVAERAALLRSMLARRRVLLVLDNAADVEQVRPLLPGTATCCVVVTSRDSLAALVARHGAQRLVVELMTEAESVRLLGALIGDRMAAPGAAAAAADVARWCAGLPLALRIAAEHLVARPYLSVAALADELRDERRRLDVLDSDGDEQTALRTVFAWSYRSLTPDQARAFSLLGAHFGVDLDRRSAAELLGGPPAGAARQLDALIRGHLVRPVGADRFDMHDLLRAYAAERADELAEDERRAARRGCSTTTARTRRSP